MTMNPQIPSSHPWEQFAFRLYPKRGKCSHSPFAGGYHRVGLIPTESLLDGGAPGDVLTEYCMHCGKKFKASYFIIKSQPRSLTDRPSA